MSQGLVIIDLVTLNHLYTDPALPKMQGGNSSLILLTLRTSQKFCIY